MIKYLLDETKLMRQVPLGRYGVIIGGNLASSNTMHFFSPFSPLSFPLHCLLPSLLLVSFPVFAGLTLDQPGAQGILVIASLCTPLSFHHPLFLSSSHLERKWRPKGFYLGYP